MDDVLLARGTGSLTPLTEQTALAEPPLTTEGHALGTVVSDACGLSDVYPKSTYPDARIDAYMFSPCGFSANGVVPAPAHGGGGAVEEAQAGGAAHYFTVHVTPEPNCSFASFETNVPGGQKGRETADIIEHVVSIFRPGRFSVTLFETKAQGHRRPERRGPIAEPPAPFRARSGWSASGGYRRIDRIVHDFEDLRPHLSLLRARGLGWTMARPAWGRSEPCCFVQPAVLDLLFVFCALSLRFAQRSRSRLP